MKKNMKRILTAAMFFAMMFMLSIPAFAAEEAVQAVGNALGDKAYAAAIAVGIAAAAGAIGMGWAIAKSAEAISRQPEAESKIRTTLMLGLVFVETAIIYALVIAILIIFVL
ncbi:MAG: ATP synthase F0 subunit C [Clostridia bacterium]|nr:ATP synthase F0 subunit C [Clostridia bacterium]